MMYCHVLPPDQLLSPTPSRLESLLPRFWRDIVCPGRLMMSSNQELRQAHYVLLVHFPYSQLDLSHLWHRSACNIFLIHCCLQQLVLPLQFRYLAQDFLKSLGRGDCPQLSMSPWNHQI